jgi:hypothetical protein
MGDDELSRSWIAPSVVAPLPSVVPAPLAFDAGVAPLDPDAPIMNTPSPRGRSPWRVRPTAGVFAPVVSNVEDLVARFGSRPSDELEVEEGLAAFVSAAPSPLPAPVAPRDARGAAGQPRRGPVKGAPDRWLSGRERGLGLGPPAPVPPRSR